MSPVTPIVPLTNWLFGSTVPRRPETSSRRSESPVCVRDKVSLQTLSSSALRGSGGVVPARRGGASWELRTRRDGRGGYVMTGRGVQGKTET